MPFYALATIPLISACKSDLSSEVWFADDATGCGSLTSLRSWWDKLNTYGPQFGYHPNGCKTWLITKQALEQTATNIFANTNVHVTTEGRKHLGAPLGSNSYIKSIVSEQVKEWTEELNTLSQIARIHPHAAYCAYIHGLKSKWLYLTRTTPEICDLLEPIKKGVKSDQPCGERSHDFCQKSIVDLMFHSRVDCLHLILHFIGTSLLLILY